MFKTFNYENESKGNINFIQQKKIKIERQRDIVQIC